MSSTAQTVKHLPYQIDETRSKGSYYETYWKEVGLEHLLRHASPQAFPRVLDYGCGRGEFLSMAAEAGFQAQGCDPDPVCVDLSRKHGPCELLDLENPHALFGPAQFDVVSCFHVLEHVPHPMALLRYFITLCRPGGYLLLVVPNLRVFTHLRKKPLPGKTIVNEGHLHGWDHATFLNLMTRHLHTEFCGWAFDATLLPVISPFIQSVFGLKAVIRVETKFFRKLLPYHGHSIIGLFRVPE